MLSNSHTTTGDVSVNKIGDEILSTHWTARSQSWNHFSTKVVDCCLRIMYCRKKREQNFSSLFSQYIKLALFFPSHNYSSFCWLEICLMNALPVYQLTVECQKIWYRQFYDAHPSWEKFLSKRSILWWHFTAHFLQHISYTADLYFLFKSK